MAKHKVLSTKKLKSSLVELAREKGFEIIEKEFIQVKGLETERQVLDENAVVVFTSANAVQHAPIEEFKGKIFCISGATKKAVEARFPNSTIICTADDAAALADKIIDEEVEEVIFFCGNKRRDVLLDNLQQAGIKVKEMVVYETAETPEKLDDDFDAVLFFSPSAVNSFFKVNQLKEAAVYFAIGDTTADAIKGFTTNNVLVSEAPTQEAVIELLITHY
ncbi:MAG TPA: uroporphyrinogen-III synthase [Flavisolibacter sp.]|nr:uroporphyrinogen-III synthase [Flavisolibacter sp.]